ncbi:glycosyltransferase [Cupriavidus basilensis]|uniref:glycosyltransferase n=1 Tax=Cupriavidus basilensis TaxID=68895 RepID=UPI0023E89F37|nr:glycosyltransferase family 1 protein [Cupriavidus basilensis]MDF3886545.1 glycosyltransferase family 1 protein [Cupriavidus basilensis]
MAYFYDNPDNSTFRYRIYNMMQAMSLTANEIGASYFHLGDEEHIDAIVERADVIVFCRTRYSLMMMRVALAAKERGKRVLFDVDDFVFNVDYIHLILNTLDVDTEPSAVWDFWYAYIGRIGSMLKLCDEAIATNEFLAQRISEFTGRPVHVIPNFLNREQLDVSDRIYEQKARQNFRRDGRFHLGYFSGSPSHNKDLGLVEEALAELLSRRSDVVVRVAGYMEIKGPLAAFRDRIEFLPFRDFVNLQHAIGEVEINLMPLQDNLFTNCKSELKYFDAAVVGTLSVASPVYTYSKAIQDGHNGFLASDHQWYSTLTRLVEASPSEMASWIQAAREDARVRYGWNSQAGLIETVLFPADGAAGAVGRKAQLLLSENPCREGAR